MVLHLMDFLHDFFCLLVSFTSDHFMLYFQPSLGWMLRLWQRWISWFDRDFWDQYEASARGIPQRSGEMILNAILISLPEECLNVSELRMLIVVLQAEFECINSKKKQKKKNYKNSGVVSVKVCQVLCHINTLVWFYSQHSILKPMQTFLDMIVFAVSDYQGIHLFGLHHGRLPVKFHCKSLTIYLFFH